MIRVTSTFAALFVFPALIESVAILVLLQGKEERKRERERKNPFQRPVFYKDGLFHFLFGRLVSDFHDASSPLARYHDDELAVTRRVIISVDVTPSV